MPNKTFTQFRVDNVTETLPTTLAYGQEVYYKDSTGALTLYVGDESGVAQPVVGSGYPSRVVNVFGTANNVAPNFTTVSGALTYANSLTPIVTEPVVIRLFAKADGTPYDLTGLSSWTTYANQYIYFESDFVRLNETTTLPTTLPAGKEVWYVDGNNEESLWVGDSNGTAIRVAEEIEYGTFTPTFAVGDAGTITATSTLLYSRIGRQVRIYGGCSITPDSPVGPVTMTNLPYLVGQIATIGFYRIGDQVSVNGTTNSTYACSSEVGVGISLGDGSVFNSPTTLFIDIVYSR